MVALSRVQDVSSNQSNPVHPVYRCKLTPVVIKLGTHEIPGQLVNAHSVTWGSASVFGRDSSTRAIILSYGQLRFVILRLLPTPGDG